MYQHEVAGRGGGATRQDPANAYHLEHYGHPSKFGYKDIIPLWKAEKWNPEQLIALYKKAGARYFVSMGSHHDNFFLWNSKIHPWNAVQMGPKKDVVGLWQKAAKNAGMRFGVSEHLGASYHLVPERSQRRHNRAHGGSPVRWQRSQVRRNSTTPKRRLTTPAGSPKIRCGSATGSTASRN